MRGFINIKNRALQTFAVRKKGELLDGAQFSHDSEKRTLEREKGKITSKINFQNI